MDLLGSDSSDEDVSFKINEGYAKNYEKWRKKEEKQKLLDKYGPQDSDSSSEEEEIRSTPQMDKDWLRAYAVVRFKQPRLYKEGEKFFKDTAKPVSKKKEKTTTLKDHERKFILEKGGIDEECKIPETVVGKSYFEEQEEIKKNLKAAIGDSSSNESDGEEDLLVKADKTEEQKQQEENEYLEWLKGERESLGDPDAEAELAPLKQYWNDPSLSEKERVLRDYILNNGYMDQDESDSDSDDDAPTEVKGPDPDEEEKFLAEAEKYEHKYNFRHEEPGGDEEKEKVKDEIRLLQKLQMEEKMEKLEKLRKIAHKPELDYDLDADFDPDKHNEIMKKYFDDDYYEEDDANQKPEFDYDAAIDEEEDEWWKERLQEKGDEEVEEENDGSENAETSQDQEEADNAEPDVDDPNFIMDADFDPSRDYKAEKKRAKKYGKAFAKKLPIFDPTTKTFDEYIDEYLKDKINDLPFTYRKVVPNDYGLTTEEILSLPDRELNAWVSVKKMSQFRTPREEAEERRRFQARASDLEKKKKILPSLFANPEENPEVKSKKKKKKRKRKKADAESDVDNQEAGGLLSAGKEDISPVKKAKMSPSKVCADDSPKTKSSGKKNKKSLSVEKESKSSHNASQAEENQTNDRQMISSETKNSKKKQKKIDQEKKLSSPNKGATPEINNSSQNVEEKQNGKTSKTKKSEKKNIKKGVSDVVISEVKKSKKRKRKSDGEEQVRKKKKLSIKMSKNLTGDKPEEVTDNKNLKRQLSKIMSASRLGKYGLGPNTSNSKNGKKKSKKKNLS
ncbi:hypothetical protein EGW08_022796 [Elysia chlorotica]|uniref:Protein KRI1 homolog n=1 Tax=Elysia chlorotica TaxID=188477 RepID=A0A3S1AQS8_ELYCH|nr:hypothetical protein EGW08_022796 [Elysia chlorotica]